MTSSDQSVESAIRLETVGTLSQDTSVSRVEDLTHSELASSAALQRVRYLQGEPPELELNNLIDTVAHKLGQTRPRVDSLALDLRSILLGREDIEIVGPLGYNYPSVPSRALTFGIRLQAVSDATGASATSILRDPPRAAMPRIVSDFDFVDFGFVKIPVVRNTDQESRYSYPNSFRDAALKALAHSSEIGSAREVSGYLGLIYSEFHKYDLPFDAVRKLLSIEASSPISFSDISRRVPEAIRRLEREGDYFVHHFPVARLSEDETEGGKKLRLRDFEGDQLEYAFETGKLTVTRDMLFHLITQAQLLYFGNAHGYRERHDESEHLFLPNWVSAVPVGSVRMPLDRERPVKQFSTVDLMLFSPAKYRELVMNAAQTGRPQFKIDGFDGFDQRFNRHWFPKVSEDYSRTILG